VNPYVPLALVALVVTALISALLLRLWERDDQRDVERKWQERERRLDRRKPVATRREILRRRMWRERPTSRGPAKAARSRGGLRSGRNISRRGTIS
jgi:hypothetical protein